MEGGIYYLESEFYTLKGLAMGKKLTIGEELAIQHILAKTRELNEHLLNKGVNNDASKRSADQSNPNIWKRASNQQGH